MSERTCPKCGTTYPEIEGNFYTYKTGAKAGKPSTGWCKECCRADQRERNRQYRATPEGKALLASRRTRMRVRQSAVTAANLARSRACDDLVERYRDEYDDLLAQHTVALQAEAALLPRGPKPKAAR